MQISMPISSLRTNSFGENGGTLNSPLILSRDPQENLEAATKQYIDNKLTSVSADSIVNGILTANRFPNLTGDISSVAGSGVLNLSNTGVSPGSYAKVTVTNKGRVTSAVGLTPTDIPNLEWNKITTGKPTTLGGYGISNGLSKLGGEVSGYITSMVSPTQTMHAVNKSYVTSVHDTASAIATGTIVKRPSSVTPDGFLKVNGAELSKTEYSALYSVIGDQYSLGLSPGAGKPWEQQYYINNSSDSTLANSIGAGTHPLVSFGNCVFITKNKAYTVGGYTGNNGVNINSTYTANINSDGTLGTWSDTNNNLPKYLAYADLVIIKNKVYLLGGQDQTSTANVVIYTANINADGTLTTWQSVGNIPVNFIRGNAVVTKNRVYLLGGHYLAYVSASIDNDGNLGTWITHSGYAPVNGSHYDASAVVVKNNIYLLGGGDNSGDINKAWVAAIDSNGFIGVWSDSNNNLPSTTRGCQCIVTNKYVFIVTGIAGGNYGGPIYRSQINLDGTLGTWSVIGTAIGFLAYSRAIVTNSKVYVICGYGTLSGAGTGPTRSIMSFDLSGGLNDYSPYYDGTLTPTDSTKFRLPDYTAQSTNGSYFFIKT